MGEEDVGGVGIVADLGVKQISIADTVGKATAEQVKDLMSAVLGAHGDLEIGAHLHSTPATAAEKIAAAYDAGCRRFDSAIGGLGGCPFAQDALVGNIATESGVEALAERGAEVPLRKPRDSVIKLSADIARKYAPIQ